MNFSQNFDKTAQGYIHSIETGGMVDGPGIRYVVFFSGCPLRCKYCHNPDTWKMKSGKLKTVEEIIKDALKYKNYLRFSGGGMTITGGEPFMQPKFMAELLKAARANGIHTAVDTSGYAAHSTVSEALDYTDLLLLDIKSINPDTFQNVAGVPIHRTLDLLEAANHKRIPVWIRFVLVPGLTDNVEDMKKMADFLRPYRNIEKIEVLPFHKMGEYKWEELGMDYELHDTPSPTAEQLDLAKSILAK